ncbi:MAG TPA: hypothetical protein VKM55_09575 [Candidatus Lokiarchaeia archaeon]|nr:hypothetical protein [Candidatus Lokiarchaeia archaeon]
MPKCKTCGSNFSDQSRRDFEAAPAWSGECPACSKKKFASYITDYLLRLMSIDELVQLSKEYFGDDRPENLQTADPVAKIVSILIDFVIAKNGSKGGKPPATAGHAITRFVKHFDYEIKQHLRRGTDSRVRKFIIVALVCGIILVTGAIILSLYFHGVFG